MDATIKRFPCGLFSQSAVDAALRLRSKVPTVDEIAEVTVGTFRLGKAAMGSDPEKWRPQTRESADHSLPYVVATALMYGSVEMKHFHEDFFRKPQILKLMARIKVEETEECNSLYPAASPGRVDLTTTSGKKWSELVPYHRGHFQNPMNDKEIEEKFHSLTKDLLPKNRRDKVLTFLWDLEHVKDIHTIVELFRVRQKKTQS